MRSVQGCSGKTVCDEDMNEDFWMGFIAALVLICGLWVISAFSEGAEAKRIMFECIRANKVQIKNGWYECKPL